MDLVSRKTLYKTWRVSKMKDIVVTWKKLTATTEKNYSPSEKKSFINLKMLITDILWTAFGEIINYGTL